MSLDHSQLHTAGCIPTVAAHCLAAHRHLDPPYCLGGLACHKLAGQPAAHVAALARHPRDFPGRTWRRLHYCCLHLLPLPACAQESGFPCLPSPDYLQNLYWVWWRSLPPPCPTPSSKGTESRTTTKKTSLAQHLGQWRLAHGLLLNCLEELGRLEVDHGIRPCNGCQLLWTKLV